MVSRADAFSCKTKIDLRYQIRFGERCPENSRVTSSRIYTDALLEKPRPSAWSCIARTTTVLFLLTFCSWTLLLRPNTDMKILCKTGVVMNWLRLEDATQIFNHSYKEYYYVRENFFAGLLSFSALLFLTFLQTLFTILYKWIRFFFFFLNSTFIASNCYC